MQQHLKRGFLLAFLIAGTAVTGYGFARIEDQQKFQDKITHNIQAIVRLKSNAAAACHTANVLRAQTNTNSLSEYRAWVVYSTSITAKPLTEAAQRALVPVLEQTWIPLTDCEHAPAASAAEGYPVPSAILFRRRLPPPSALYVPPSG